jgi:hypothetical protein
MTIGFDRDLYVLPFDHRGSFEMAERHVRRLGKVASLEEGR